MCKSSGPSPLNGEDNEEDEEKDVGEKVEQTQPWMMLFITEVTEAPCALEMPPGSFLIKLLSQLCVLLSALLCGSTQYQRTTHISLCAGYRKKEREILSIYTVVEPPRK
jgi:hypothetical protein